MGKIQGGPGGGRGNFEPIFSCLWVRRCQRGKVSGEQRCSVSAGPEPPCTPAGGTWCGLEGALLSSGPQVVAVLGISEIGTYGDLCLKNGGLISRFFTINMYIGIVT